EELPLSREKTECCSYGGLMWLANSKLAKKVVERRINESPNQYVTYCTMCRDFFVKQGKPTKHILDLMLGTPEGFSITKTSPRDFSTRHENRVNLKQKLLKELWGEKMESSNEFENISLLISDEVRSIMEDRLILVEDIRKVIDYAERTGLMLANRHNDHLLAYFCPGYVTYWVEFSKEGDSYKIHNTYSHRMTINEGATS
ncbi:MAG TPA: hypothetical protein VF338_03090, partial [Leptolinea sp.]